VSDGDKTYTDVGIHLKGAVGSRRPFDDKPALTLNFDKFVPGQRYHGIDKLHLNNSVQDSTFLMEIVCGEMFLKAGVPAARGTHALVELQGRKRGLYVLKEGFDTTFLRHHFKNVTGNLYDGGFLTDIDRPIRKASGGEPGPDHADLQALAVACRLPDLAQRAERLEKLLDVDRFISLVALEVMTWHWDGYGMHANNYRAYHDPDSGKITIMPHGMDQMFGNVGGPIDPPSAGLIARRMFQMPQYRERYYARLAELREKVLVPDELDKRVDELVARLKPVLEESDRGLARRVAENAKSLKAQMRRQADAIDKQLAARAEKK
jgi:spore coat protein CotH